MGFFDKQANIDKPASTENTIVVQNLKVVRSVRQNADLQKWQRAIHSAEDHFQNRAPLYNLYKHVLLDGYLKSLISKRIMAITTADLRFFDKNGEEVEAVTALAKQPYFEKLATEIMNAIFWGFTLCELDWPAPSGDVSKGATHLIPRKHVKPRFHLVTENEHDTKGLDYTDEEYVGKVIWAGDTEDLGLLLEASRYVIFKSNNLSDYAEYAETQGLPLLIGKYDNEQTRQSLEDTFEQLGPGGKITAPKQAEIEYAFPASNSNGGTLYNDFRKALNEELAVLILGQTMTTTDSTNAGFAQGKVHADVLQSIHTADRQFFVRVLNNMLNSYLATIGWPTEGGEWRIVDEDQMPLDKRILVDKALNEIVPIPDEYWAETYGIPIDGERKEDDE